MDSLIKHLKSLELNEEEMQVYLASLEAGNSTVLALAISTGIPRTTVYLLVEDLLKKGLLILTIKGKKKHFVPASPTELVALAENKQEKYKKIAKDLELASHELHSYYNLAHQSSKIRYFKGIDGIKKIFSESLTADKIYIQIASKASFEVLHQVIEDYRDKIRENMISTQEIITNLDQNREHAKENSSTRNEILYVPQKHATSVDQLIYSDCVAFITYKDSDPAGIVIQDQSIVHFELMKFLHFWNMVKVEE